MAKCVKFLKPDLWLHCPLFHEKDCESTIFWGLVVKIVNYSATRFSISKQLAI
jgi:hypothetical protein